MMIIIIIILAIFRMMREQVESRTKWYLHNLWIDGGSIYLLGDCDAIIQGR